MLLTRHSERSYTKVINIIKTRTSSCQHRFLGQIHAHETNDDDTVPGPSAYVVVQSQVWINAVETGGGDAGVSRFSISHFPFPIPEQQNEIMLEDDFVEGYAGLSSLGLGSDAFYPADFLIWKPGREIGAQLPLIRSSKLWKFTPGKGDDAVGRH
ncbi:hypothetical protein CHU98_g7877 [Xylaria longipes]|nr:hypothetical protein CHU98_g7877 [Xylaria longipes]